nr:MAG TPA: hypothetical protein [Caudoviricetes sp.]
MRIGDEAVRRGFRILAGESLCHRHSEQKQTT